jgi:Na+/melibiose symporter-like transporter
VSATYFALWYFAMYFGWTMIEIPMASWMSDLAHDYEGRSRVVTYRTTFQYGGLFLFALIPLTPILMPSLGLLEGTEIDPAAMRAIAMLVIILLPLGVLSAIVFVPQGSYLESHSERISFKEILLSLIGNKPARLFYFSHTMNAIATGLLHAVYLFWADNHLGLGEQVPWILLVISVTNIAGISLWHRVMLKLQRHQVWAVGGTLSALLVFSMSLIAPGDSGFFWVLLVSGGYGILIASTYIAAPSVLADLVDYDTLKTGHNKAANYYAGYYWLQKINIALGGAFAFWLLDWLGFQAEAAEQTASGTLALILNLSLLPGVLFVAASVVMWFFPLNRRKQEIVRKRLETRPIE